MPKDKNKLTDRHRKLVDFYFGVSNFNKTDALRREGYAHPNKNCDLFNHPNIKAEVARRHAVIRERYKVSYDRVVEELARIAFSSPLDYTEISDDGTFVIDLSKIDADQIRALGEMSSKTYTDSSGNVVTELKLKPWSKQAALDSLMRHAGLSKEKSPFEGAGDLVERIIAARKRSAPK